MKPEERFTETEADRMIPDAAIMKALSLGADVAGVVPVHLLTSCQSAQCAGPQGLAHDSGSVIVLGLYHDPDHPEMDWWEEGRSTPGDRILHGMTTALSRWLREAHNCDAHDIPYQVSERGIYLKDAAVLAGLGVFGRNNLVIVPGFGPRVRFRALWADFESERAAPCECLPVCDECSQPCRTNCPQQAFSGGEYHRERCLLRMDADKASAGIPNPGSAQNEFVQHCRNCELFCIYPG